MQLIEGIDPNPENYVCAGIIHTKTLQVGCLLRLEPNKQAGVSIVACNLVGLLLTHCIHSFADVPINCEVKQGYDFSAAV